MNDQQLNDVYSRAIAQHPELSDRYQRGITIYKQNEIAAIGSHRLEVHSQNSSQVYIVEMDPNNTYCTCPDKRAPVIAGKRYCKHLIAASLFAKNGPYTSN